MWDFGDFVAKAELYFGRGAAHPRIDNDDAAAIWLVQGLEFLLRAVLAEENPMLLAEAKSEAALMHAAGFPVPSKKPLVSIPVTLVIERVAVVVPEFSPYQHDARALVDMRNGEAHSSLRPFDVDAAVWLPRFTRVVEVLCDHLALDVAEVVGEDVIRQGRALVDAEDLKLQQVIQQRIQDAWSYLTGLTAAEIASRMEEPLPAVPPEEMWVPAADLPYRRLGGVIDWEWLPHDGPATDEVDPYDLTPVGPRGPSRVEQLLEQLLAQPAPTLLDTPACPACQRRAGVYGRLVRASTPHLENERLVRDVVYVATHLLCLICGLRLTSTAEIRSAGLPQQIVLKQWRESTGTEQGRDSWRPLR